MGAEYRHQFLFGAGASAFSGPCTPKCPPLGVGLIDELIPRLRVAAFVDLDLLDLFRRDFEAGMDAFWRRNPEMLQSFLQDMAGYFSDFFPEAGNLYKQFVEVINNKRNKVLLSTLNYDLLIEPAISQAGGLISFSGFDAPSGNTPLLKLHGSCNFIPDMGPGSVSGINLVIPVPEVGTRSAGIAGFPIKPVDVPELRAILRSNDTRVPAMAVYHASKMVRDCPHAILAYQDWWRKELLTADALFVIGTRLVEHDTHIWDAVKSYTGPVYWVSPSPDEALAWAKINGVRMVPYEKTFADFIPRYNREF